VLGVFFLIPLMLTSVHGLSTQQIGLLLFPGAISAVFFGPVAGTLADRRGSAFVATIGVLLLAGSMLAMAVLLGLSPWVTLLAMLANYIGFTLFQTAMINAVSQTLSEAQSGVGMGIFNLISIVAGALGTTLVGRILDGRWLDLGVISWVREAEAYPYSDILLLFTAVVLTGGWVFTHTFRAVRPLPAGAPPA
jgi:DHA2 family metal-tetracycline-proton antiporter-like MFS transporter